MCQTAHHDLPEPPPSFEGLTPASIAAEANEILARSTTLHDDLTAKLTPSTATFANLISPLITSTNLASSRLATLSTLLSAVSTSPEIRDAARLITKQMAAADLANVMRRDIAELVAAVHARQKDDTNLDDQDRYLLAKMNSKYVRSGAGVVDEAKRTRLSEATQELSDLKIAAQKTLNQIWDGVAFSHDELQGVPEKTLATMKEDKNGLWVVGDSQYGDVMRYASIEETRRKLFRSDVCRFPENVKRLEEIVALRDEIAGLLSFENHARMRIEEMMARSLEEVKTRLSELKSKLRPLAASETEELLLLKKRDLEARQASTGAPKSEVEPKFYVWDRSYYLNIQKKHEFSIDHSKVAEYFEIHTTIAAMLRIFEQLFAMKFERLQTSVWHQDVAAYSVWNSEDKESGFLGYLYVDPLARPGKRKGIGYTLGLKHAFNEEDGTRHYPLSVLVTNIAPPTLSQPSLLEHHEAKILFHELGHAVHNLVTRTKYALTKSRDFGEIPSILLENWIYEPEVLSRLGKHYLTGEALPSTLAHDIAKTKNLNQAMGVLPGVQRAEFDLDIHSPTDHSESLAMNTTTLWNASRQSALPYNIDEEPSHWGFEQAAFGHIFRNYDAAFFAYPLSQVYAADIYASVFKDNPLSEIQGRRWREVVLEKGSGESEADLLERFLGRELRVEAQFDEMARILDA